MIRKSTWFLIGVFIILLVGAVFWNRYEKTQQNLAEQTAKLDFFLEAPVERITGLTISSADGEQLVLQKSEDGSWMLIQPEGGHPDVERIDSVLLEIESFRVVSKLNSQIDKGLVGLAPANYSLVVELENDGQIQAYFGNETPTPGGYYAYVKGEPVVVVNSYSVDSLLDLLDEPPIINTPTPTSES